LIKEIRARVDDPVRLVVGKPTGCKALAAHGHDPNSMMEFLRQQTYALSSKPLKPSDHGFEFEERWKA